MNNRIVITGKIVVLFGNPLQHIAYVSQQEPLEVFRVMRVYSPCTVTPFAGHFLYNQIPAQCWRGRNTISNTENSLKKNPHFFKNTSLYILLVHIMFNYYNYNVIECYCNLKRNFTPYQASGQRWIIQLLWWITINNKYDILICPCFSPDWPKERSQNL